MFGVAAWNSGGNARTGVLHACRGIPAGTCATKTKETKTSACIWCSLTREPMKLIFLKQTS